ncbi:solute carrier family 25 member 45 [Tribolium castaneum]|uniref:Congested-like trachea protein n=1 Tax=Tribolium castaneum TaxID=7070 RepID=D6WT03_TRICA|nr:Congested-like trachea protein [Tribolium castaneum]
MDGTFKFADFIAGWFGGICGVVVGHPLDTIKVRQQNFGTKLFVAISRTFRHEGIPGFFKGMLCPVLTIGPSNAILFGVYGNLMNVFNENYVPRQVSHTDFDALRHVFIAGTIGGFFQSLFVCPAELVKTLMQIKTEGKGSWRRHSEVVYTGSIDAFFGIVRDRGFRGLFRGFAPMAIRDVPTSGLYTVTYEALNSYFEQCHVPLMLKQTIAGGTAGVASWILVIPFDVVKSRIQADSYNHPQYKGMIDCFYKSYQRDGLGIFFKGAPAIVMRTFPVNAALFVGYEAVLRHL